MTDQIFSLLRHLNEDEAKNNTHTRRNNVTAYKLLTPIVFIYMRFEIEAEHFRQIYIEFRSVNRRGTKKFQRNGKKESN